MDRQEGRIGRGALFAQRGQHDRLHRLEAGQHVQQRRVEPAGGVIFRRGREFVVEAEPVEKRAQHRVIMMREALELAERVRHLRQRLAEMMRQHLAVRHVVGHLAQAIHVIGEGEQPRRDAVVRQHAKGVAHHGRARHLAEGADMRQARGAIARLEEHVGLAGALDPSHEFPRFLERPGLRLHGSVKEGKRRGGGRRRGRHGRSPVERRGGRHARRPAKRRAH